MWEASRAVTPFVILGRLQAWTKCSLIWLKSTISLVQLLNNSALYTIEGNFGICQKTFYWLQTSCWPASCKWVDYKVFTVQASVQKSVRAPLIQKLVFINLIHFCLQNTLGQYHWSQRKAEASSNLLFTWCKGRHKTSVYITDWPVYLGSAAFRII